MAKILVVDDEQNLVDSLQYSLRAEGYEVAIARDSSPLTLNGSETLTEGRLVLCEIEEDGDFIPNESY